MSVSIYCNSMLQNPFIYSVIENYSSGINAVELSERCGYTCFRTFQRHFKKHFNDTVYNWILKRKMEDVHSEHLKDGEIIYVTAPDTLITRSGNQRIEINIFVLNAPATKSPCNLNNAPLNSIAPPTARTATSASGSAR